MVIYTSPERLLLVKVLNQAPKILSIERKKLNLLSHELYFRNQISVLCDPMASREEYLWMDKARRHQPLAKRHSYHSVSEQLLRGWSEEKSFEIPKWKRRNSKLNFPIFTSLFWWSFFVWTSLCFRKQHRETGSMNCFQYQYAGDTTKFFHCFVFEAVKSIRAAKKLLTRKFVITEQVFVSK